jgi:REP element-mobilizing transposase RayT
MPQSLVKVAIHVVFGTKQRKNLIPDGREEALWAYVGGIARNTNVVLIIAGGMRDHLHLLFEMSGTMTIADTVRTFKANSSRWLRKGNPEFAWQGGYGAFSVSPSHIKTVKEYIANQREHHKKRSFEEEFLLLLKKAGVDYDPRYVFD